MNAKTLVGKLGIFNFTFQLIVI